MKFIHPRRCLQFCATSSAKVKAIEKDTSEIMCSKRFVNAQCYFVGVELIS